MCGPLDPVAYLVNIRAERLSENIDRALDHHAEAIACYPNHAEAHNSQVVVLMLNGESSVTRVPAVP